MSNEPSIQDIQKILHVIDGLEDVIERETDALNNTDTDGFMALQDEKLEKARHYQDMVQMYFNAKNPMKIRDSVLLDKLEARRQKFHEAATRNKERIERMQASSKRLGDRIMALARKAAEQGNQLTYGQKGEFTKGRNATMGVNESA